MSKEGGMDERGCEGMSKKGEKDERGEWKGEAWYVLGSMYERREV